MIFEVRIGEHLIPSPAQRRVEENDILKLQEKFKAVFGSFEGADVLSYLMYRYHFWESVHAVGDDGGRHTAYQEGQRSVVMGLLAFLTKDPAKLIAELKAQEKENDNNPQ